jgi:hypothetical protein
MRSNTPTRPTRLYHRDDGSVSGGSQKLSPPGCPFCGKAPLSKSGLSAHLLSCQKKKEAKERREAHALNVQNQPVVLADRRNTPQRTNVQRVASPAPRDRTLDKAPTRGSSIPHVSRMVPFR